MVIVVAVIMGITQAVKQTGYMDKKWSALFAVFVGVLWAWVAGDGDTAMRIFEGVISGLTAAGLYSSGKSIVK